MNQFKSPAIILLLIILSLSIKAQYAITIRIDGYTDSSLLLTSYYGNKIRLIDTAYITKPGVFKFEGKKDLPGGIYMAVSKDKAKLFEFVVNDKQKFSLETDTSSFSMNMQVNGSDENEIFFEYLKLNERLFRENTELSAKLKAMDTADIAYLETKLAIDSINLISAEYKLKVINERPDLFVAKLFKAMKNADIPQEISASEDSSAAYFYYKNHFFDEIDLSDPRMLRTPLFSRKVEEYFKNMVVVQPDSAIAAIDFVITKTRPSEEMTSYLVWYFTSEYQNPDYMGFDKVFVYLVDNYFSKEEIENATPSILKTLQDRANRIRPLIIGEPAPDLILLDTIGLYKSFQSLTNDYIIVLFWDVDCGICKNEIFELQKIYKKIWFDFEVFAVNVNADLDKWKDGIKKMKLTWVNVNGTRSVTQDFHDLYDISGTPAIFILDKDHHIIAKHISAKQILPFLEKYSKK